MSTASAGRLPGLYLMYTEPEYDAPSHMQTRLLAQRSAALAGSAIPAPRTPASMTTVPVFLRIEDKMPSSFSVRTVRVCTVTASSSQQSIKQIDP